MFKLSKFFILSGLMSCCLTTSAEDIKHFSSPKDLGVVDKERILYWLEKRGDLATNASAEARQQAFDTFIKFSGNNIPKALSLKMLSNSPAVTSSNQTAINKGLTKQYSKSSDLQKASEDVTSTAKVLAIMIDFQDLKYDNHGLTTNDTDMYYPEYPVSHYDSLLFSPTGFTGPSGQNLESAYQFYQHESGETFELTGDTFGWITADNNARYYGANGNDGNDSNATELIIEAVEKVVAQNNIDLSEYDLVSSFDHDNDGDLNEPDGVVDHLMIFHSSIGEESGGGQLGSDAIWSHRFFVADQNFNPVAVQGSTTKIYSYTITPIDSAPGVVVHEFGHVLGVPDEYDTGTDNIGAPVQAWSVMGSGTWLGDPRGTQPVSFSPYARDYFQNRYGGNWINQQSITLSPDLNETININSATNHTSGINQIKVNLPSTPVDFGSPYSGEYQYYSNKGNELENSFSFTATIPSSNPVLSMKARWDIEAEYDYVVVKVNNVAIPGNHTQANNSVHSGVSHYITGKSADKAGATADLGWVDLTFGLSLFSNQTVTIEIEYKTDESLGGYGFAVDDIEISDNNTPTYSNGAETAATVNLDGFSRITDQSEGSPRYYYVQLRNHTLTDSGLEDLDYEPGVLLWYRDEGIDDNNVSQHPGDVFIGVVDADQNLIMRNNSPRNTQVQLRDATFSLYWQSITTSDTAITNNPVFNDKDDYSSPGQPESGINLPILGLNMEVKSQANDSSTASVLFTKNDTNSIIKSQNGLTVDLTVDDEELTSSSTFTWQLGDGTELTGNPINHTYNNAGDYNVEVSYTTSEGEKELSLQVSVAEPIEGSINLSSDNAELTFSASLSGGSGDYIYRWNFGDNTGVSTNSSGTYTYNNAGRYTVILTVSDETGESYQFSESIDIDNPLIASFSSSITNLVANFSSDVTGGTRPYSYLWDFGDSQTSTQSDPSHTFNSTGTYTVRLTITDADNQTQTITSTITVNTASNTGGANTSDDSGSSGGSMHWLTLVFAALLLNRRFTSNKTR